MTLSDFPFLIHRVYYDVGPLFAAVIASTLLGRLSTRFRRVWPFFQKCICEVTHWCWLLVSALIHPKGVLLGWGQDSVQASKVHPHQTLSSMSLWTLLCALLHSHVGTGRGHPQNVPTKLGAWNCPISLGMLKHSEFLSLELRLSTSGAKPSSWKTTPHLNPPSTKLYTWHNAHRQVPFSWQLPNQDLSITLPYGEVRFDTPENMSPLL